MKYLVKHFVRTFLTAAVTEADWVVSPGSLGSCTVEKAHANWLPDQTNSMGPLKHRTLAEVRHLFGASPLFLAMLGCFAQAASPDVQKSLLDKAVPIEAWLEQVNTWEEWRANHPMEEDCWPPALYSLAAASRPAAE